jgi:hypothetical protein
MTVTRLFATATYGSRDAGGTRQPFSRARGTSSQATRTVAGYWCSSVTTTLFAALEVLEGKVIGECFPRHTNREFLRLFRRLDWEVPCKLTLHLILDNYGSHTHPNVKA